MTAFAVFAALPLGVVAAVPRLHDQGQLAVRAPDTLIPVSGTVQATRSGNTVRLSWGGLKPSTARSFYHVLRATGSKPDVACAGRVNNSADNCILYSESIATTRGTTFVDRPGPGRWTYRIGVAANWVDDPTLGDIYVVTKPTTLALP